MAVNTLPSASVLAKKASLLEKRDEWRTIRCNGMRRVVMPNETGSRVYLVDPRGKACNCKAGQFGTLCAHRLAVIEAANQDAIQAWVDEQQDAAPLFPRCRSCGRRSDYQPCDDCAAAETRRLEQAGKAALAGSRYARIFEGED